jgi:UDP-glucose 4-epimerase
VQKKRILVTGGAGYIGSHTVRLLLEQGYDVDVIDDLSRGHRHNVPAAKLYELSLCNSGALEEFFRQVRVDAVIHFAAFIAVGESMNEPGRYFHNNVGGSLSLLRAMERAGVRRIVFSSSAAIFGTPDVSPIPEDAAVRPVSPYGETKAMTETMLRWFDEIHGLTSVSLRYFNAAGGDPAGTLGEEHEPETHLIPLIFRAIKTGNPVTVFGDDYDTPDGSCIRDYIHVDDLAQAHILSLEHLINGGETRQFNVGTGRGHSVLQVIRAVEAVTGRTVPYVVGPRRAGDPPSLVAASGKLRESLGWNPRYSDIDTIIRHAWNFSEKRSGAGAGPAMAG